MISEFYASLDWALLSLDFINTEQIPFLSSVSKNFEESEVDEYISIIGIDHGSSILNSLSLLLALFAVIFIHFIVALLYSWAENNGQSGCWNKFISKLYNMLTFSYYIRFFSETMLVISIYSLSEVHGMETTGNDMISFAYSWFLLIMVFWFLIFQVITWWTQNSIPREDLNPKISELFTGLKGTKPARLFPIMDTVRKLMLCSILLAHPSADKYHKISLFCWTQLIFTFYILGTKPFSFTKLNIQEFCNTLIFTFFSLCLYRFNTEDSHSDMSQYVRVDLKL